MQFADYFSQISANYARYRPTYPPALYEYLAGLAPARDSAWDCATGSGQAALGLAQHFAQVIATDASASQIANAQPHPRVLYRVAPAEHSGLDDRSLDLVSVAQALHWFDLDAFYAEVRRVLRPGGVLAAWTYRASQIEPEIDEILNHFDRHTLGPYWPAQIQASIDEYRGLPFPFAEITPPEFWMEQTWSLFDLLGYLSSWSAVQRYREARGENPIDLLLPRLAQAWGPPDQPKPVRWRVPMRIGRRKDDP